MKCREVHGVRKSEIERFVFIIYVILESKLYIKFIRGKVGEREGERERERGREREREK